jgi:two-component system, chemotaxis family, sensor kinase CheA
MTIDLAQFHDAFFEESFEAIDTMEGALLKLKVGAADKELINTIFRVAHSIKGGSATFGFAEIASFTHTLETLLDELRGGKLEVSSAVTDLLLKSVDVMREMLRSVQQKAPVDAQRVADLQLDLELAIAQPGSKAANAPAAAPTPEKNPAPVEKKVEANKSAGELEKAGADEHQWLIDFNPLPQLFVRGNDPLRMLRELADLGALEVAVDLEHLPPLSALDPESCYIAWQLSLHSEVTQPVVEQVFDWAEGDCQLKIADLAAPTPVGSATMSWNASSLSAANSGANASSPDKLDAAPDAARPSGDASSIRVSIEKIDELMNTVGELVITQSMLSQLGAQVANGASNRFQSGLTQLERNVRELQESVMRVRMLPISFVFSRFPRMVRDLSQRLGKQVELKVTGDQTELDKTVLERIGDPLMHLVRNCIDHGIESPDVRKAAGKPAHGTVHLNAYHKGGAITIEVSDDGAGLHTDKILAKARSGDLVGPDDALTDEQIHDLIFVPGFSTVDHATDISGRGVGMDVVRRNAKELGGNIEVLSTPGLGSRFIITLPLTLAIVDGQSVSVGNETYIVPLTAIVESLQLQANMVSRVVGRGEVFSFREDYVPVVRLHEIFGVEPRSHNLHEGLLMIVEGEGGRVGLFVDDLLGQQQVVIKSLETNYRRVDGVSGATILGDGSVALILDVPGLIRAAAGRRLAA